MTATEVFVPSVDICAFCSDSECGGIGCIAGLDPNDERDIPAIERLQALLRAGHAFLGAADALADAEHRTTTKDTER